MTDENKTESKTIQTYILPKGTILHNFKTKANENKNYRWYYLASQRYTSTVFSKSYDTYITNTEIILNEYFLPNIIDKKTKKIIYTPGMFNSEFYYFSRKKPDLTAKNENLDYTIPWLTYENFCSNTIDPIRSQYEYSEGTRDNNFRREICCVEYELIIPNNYVDKYTQKNYDNITFLKFIQDKKQKKLYSKLK